MNPEIPETDQPFDALARNRTLGKLADLMQPLVQKWLEGEGKMRSPIKDLLHGTLLGHPLHPALTDIPVGAWTVTAVIDMLDLVGIRRFRDAAELSIAIGALGAVAAAVTGLADWSDTTDEPKRLGMLHAVLNTTALGFYLASFAERRAGARGLGIATAFAGYGFMSFAAFLGGQLSFGLQIGVKHTAVPIDPPKEFVSAADLADLDDSAIHAVNVIGIPVLLMKNDAGVHAVGGVCTHRGAPLSEGSQDGACVKCPWHGSRFSLDDGHIVEGPATFPLACFDTDVIGGTVFVKGQAQ